MAKKKKKKEGKKHSWKAFIPFTREHNMLKAEKKVEKTQKEIEEIEEKNSEKTSDSEGYSWKAFFPFTAEGKKLRAEKKKPSGKKSSKTGGEGEKKKFSFTKHLKKGGFENVDDKKAKKGIFKFSVVIVTLISLYFIYLGSINEKGTWVVVKFMLGLWTVGFLGVLLLVAFAFMLFLDLRAYQRTKEVESVLADYLQLASANISAGMPIDRALWFAVRPSFGILAKEVEEVAKATYAGKDLNTALRDFADKFDSKTLKRSVNLILEGMSAGGEMAELLTKIAMNIEETNIQKKEMAANVTTYVIFISMATIFGAPFMFGLATQLLAVIKSITAGIGTTAATGSSFSFTLNPDAVSSSDFELYATIMLMVSSFFSAAIVSVIRKGNIKEGAVTIPVFMIVTIALYKLSSWGLGLVMGAFI